MDDLLFLDEQLRDDERMIRDSVGRFVSHDVVPLMAEAFEHATFPRELIKKSADLGLLGLTLPAEYGGAEASYVAYGLVCQELERGDSGLRSFVSVQSSLCMYPIFRYGNEEQKKRFLPAMAAGEILGCFGLTEPDSGSDPGSMRTVAKKVKGGWRLSGSKLWITNASIADIAIVWAKTDEGIRGFIVEKDFQGFVRNEIKLKQSLRASITGELVFEDVFVPEANLLPEARGLSAPLSCLSQARYGIAWGAMGAAMACFDITRDYLLERKQFDKPIASFQLIQKDLADMYTEIVKAQWLNLQIGRLKDEQRETPVMISLAKGNACREALKIARTCRNLLGANGISLEYHVIRHMLNLESVFTYEGTDNVHTLVLGRHITGINAFS
ncbi:MULTISPECIES: acyl-CoA dehydrogenase family protein [Legionella]|uniref:glutaryl-CoA dehydrogenase (ETF) n=3 Tax=Legionella oakridgensis TaxID=29423 RepID=W0BC30_9GAMM|nr:acyl-CoA dehydrogenase family protein [Legionella oakridgensis]AHE66182.1 acyl-CoA dehydrogenase [Legionella oakridgensis ATCC 33761 = DSM 21215]ETO94044.1 acyl-CoA dehydrogenase [Legionella oakridgensis RV-2-2007]KTD37291.1 glutaryl-CoA dehydrogenase [Legionella oakridgensis]STY16090.1 glutaryl-CoA dehydrogenase [Legionella longbeachae]